MTSKTRSAEGAGGSLRGVTPESASHPPSDTAWRHASGREAIAFLRQHLTVVWASERFSFFLSAKERLRLAERGGGPEAAAPGFSLEAASICRSVSTEVCVGCFVGRAEERSTRRRSHPIKRPLQSR